MSRKVSDEARVMDFFETADRIKVETVFNLVKGTMARRFPKAKDAGSPKPRKARKAKTQPTTATTTTAANTQERHGQESSAA